MFKRTTYFTTLCIAILLSVAGVSQSNAQVKQERIGYVNPQNILQQMPEFKAVQQRLQNFVQKKQKALSSSRQDLQSQIEDYQKRQSVISEDAKKKEEKRLGKLQADLQKDNRKAEQAIQQKRQELINPLNEEITKSIQNVAKQKNLSYVMNTQTNSGDLIILYASDEAQQKYDITSDVMDDLGIGE